jgi:hypothetical protein
MQVFSGAVLQRHFRSPESARCESYVFYYVCYVSDANGTWVRCDGVVKEWGELTGCLTGGQKHLSGHRAKVIEKL